MKRAALLVAGILPFATSCKLAGPEFSTTDPKVHQSSDSWIQRDVLLAVIRYLHQWEPGFDTDRMLKDHSSVELWVREVAHERDPGDRSRFAEVWFPRNG